jgi:Fe-S-cluster-containing hydrogenase component 2
MNILRRERGTFPTVDVAYRPTPCLHCADPPCARGGGEGAVYRRPDGIVLIDPLKARGRRDLPAACPHGAIWWNEEAQTPQKCTFCAHLLDAGWEAPRCVQACPTGALRVERLAPDALARAAAAGGWEGLAPGGAGAFGVYYENLYRFARCFIAGSLALERDGRSDCAGGVTVRLLCGGKCLAETCSDPFGDFKFDRLEGNSGPYAVEILGPGGPRRIETRLGSSHSIGTIGL